MRLKGRVRELERRLGKGPACPVCGGRGGPVMVFVFEGEEVPSSACRGCGVSPKTRKVVVICQAALPDTQRSCS